MPNSPRTEADILTEIVGPNRPGLSPEVAEAVLGVHLSESATTRIRDLLQKKNAGTISSVELTELDRYLRVGQFLDLMQAKARRSLDSSRLA